MLKKFTRVTGFTTLSVCALDILPLLLVFSPRDDLPPGRLALDDQPLG